MKSRIPAHSYPREPICILVRWDICSTYLQCCFFTYPWSRTQWLLSRVSSDMVFVHGSHLCLAYVVLPGMKLGVPHTFRTFRLQNHTLSSSESPELRLPAGASFPSCAVRRHPWWLDQALLPPTPAWLYLSSLIYLLFQSPAPPALETFLLLPRRHQLPAATCFMRQHTQEWQQHYLPGASQREVITSLAPKHR